MDTSVAAAAAAAAVFCVQLSPDGDGTVPLLLHWCPVCWRLETRLNPSGIDVVVREYPHNLDPACEMPGDVMG